MIAPKSLGLILVFLSIVLILLLGFIKVNSDERAATLCELFSEAGESMEDCPVHKNPNSWLIIVAFGVAFLILGTGVDLAFISKPPKSQIKSSKEETFKEIELSELDEEERAIYDLLKESKGSIYQSDLTKKTGFSKVKTSRILDRMEQKEILERKRRGMTNLIILK